MNIKVSVIIPAFNEEEYIAECINSLFSQSYPIEKFEIIVVDNNSTDRTADIARDLGVIVYTKENGPVGAVRNYGALKSTGELLAFIDADCIAPKDWLENGVDYYDNSPEDVFGGGCLLHSNSNWVEDGWLLGEDKNRVPKNLIGCSIFISRKLFFNISGFDEKITSGEDTKITNILRERNINVRILTNISVIHLGNALNVRAFFKRQLWHSENYIKNINESIKDPVFILAIFNITNIISIFINLFYFTNLLLFNLFFLMLFPLILSVKRIVRAKLVRFSIKHFIQIYYLDFLYLTARSVSIIKGVFELFYFR